MQFNVNGKQVDFAKVPHLLKPFEQWTVGHLKGLERAGLSIVSRKAGPFTLQEFAGLVIYVATEANREVGVADLDQLQPEQFGDLLAFLSDHIFPEEKPAEQPEDQSPPFDGSSAG
jgi:hypothetical protein